MPLLTKVADLQAMRPCILDKIKLLVSPNADRWLSLDVLIVFLGLAVWILRPVELFLENPHCHVATATFSSRRWAWSTHGRCGSSAIHVIERWGGACFWPAMHMQIISISEWLGMHGELVMKISNPMQSRPSTYRFRALMQPVEQPCLHKLHVSQLCHRGGSDRSDDAPGGHHGLPMRQRISRIAFGGSEPHDPLYSCCASEERPVGRQPSSACVLSH